MTKMCPPLFWGNDKSKKRAKVLLINYIVAGYANIMFINQMWEQYFKDNLRNNNQRVIFSLVILFLGLLLP